MTTATAPALVPVPAIGEDLPEARRTLADAAERADAVLAGLPAPADRAPEQQTLATDAKNAARTVRDRFLEQHGETVYRQLTDGHRIDMRLPELVAGATAEWPGLLPSAEQMAIEQGRLQAEKEGLEIDQGLFLRAVLRSPPPAATCWTRWPCRPLGPCDCSPSSAGPASSTSAPSGWSGATARRT